MKTDPVLVPIIVLMVILFASLIGVFIFVDIACPGHMEAMADLFEEMFNV